MSLLNKFIKKEDILTQSKIIRIFLPKKHFITHNAAIGNPIKHEKKSAVKETFKDKNIISNKSLSAFKIKIIESDKI